MCHEYQAYKFENLKRKYWISFYPGTDKLLYDLLIKVDNGGELDDWEIDWLDNHDFRLSPFTAMYFEMQAERLKNQPGEQYKWELIKACARWRKYSRVWKTNSWLKFLELLFEYKDEFSQRGLSLLKNLDSRDNKLKSAILTSKGAALLDVHDYMLDTHDNMKQVKKVESWAEEAIRLYNTYQPRRLLARVYHIQRKRAERDNQFEIAKELEEKIEKLKEENRKKKVDDFDVPF